METVITFDNLPVGEIVENQFNDFGITFKNANHYSSGLPKVTTSDDGKKILSIRNCSGEFCMSAVACSFRNPHQRVVLLVRNLLAETTNTILIVYDGAMNVVDTIKMPIEKFDGLAMAIEVLRDAADIGHITLFSPSFKAQLALDLVLFDEENNSSAATFNLLRQDLTFPVGLRPLMSVEEKILIKRAWGSYGEIFFEIENLPDGVTATFLPNPSNSDSVILSLTATAEVEICENKRVIVTARPLAATAGLESRTLEIPVTVAPNFAIVPLDIDVFSCTKVSKQLVVYIPKVGFDNPDPGFIPNTFFGTVQLSLFSFGGSPLPEGVEFSFIPNFVDFRDRVVSTIQVIVKAAPGSLIKKTQLLVLATNPKYPTSNATINLNPIAAELISFLPKEGNTPEGLRQGSEIFINGFGLCPQPLRFQFGNKYAVATSNYGDDRIASVRVPRLATDGPVSIVTDSGTISPIGYFKVLGFRNTHGFAFENPSMDSISFGDLSEAFGNDQTCISITIDPCRDATFGLANCPVLEVSTVPNPLSLVILGIVQSNVTAHCFGMSIACEKFIKKEIAYNLFTPDTAENAFHLLDSTGPWARLRHFLKIQSISQFSSEVVSYWLSNASNIWASSESFINEISSIKSSISRDLLRGNYPLIMLRNGGEGHVVLAYDLENGDKSNIAFYIWVYDPNYPFTDHYAEGGAVKNENKEPDEHKLREKDKGRIIIFTDGRWEFNGFNPKWGPYYFHSKSGSLVVVPYDILPKKPSLPTSQDGLVTFVFGSATTEQITNSKNRKLFTDDGSINRDADSRIEGIAPYAFFNGKANLSDAFVMKPDAYTQLIKGGENSTYSNTIVANDFALKIENVETNNSRDEIYFDPSGAKFSFKSLDDTKKLNVILTTVAKDKSVRTFTLKSTANKDKCVKVEFSDDRQKIIYKNEGQIANFIMEIGVASSSVLPSLFSSGEIALGTNDTCIVSPPWESLQEKEVSLQIIKNDGGKKKQNLFNQVQLPIIFQIDNFSVVVSADDKIELKIDASLTMANLVCSCKILWLVQKDQKVVGRYLQNMNTKELIEGVNSYIWNFYPEEPGEYIATFSSIIISNTLPPFTLKKIETKKFEVGNKSRDIIISKILANPKGPDIDNEYLAIINQGKSDIDMTGWTIRDIAIHKYNFPSFIIAAGQEVKIWTKVGNDDNMNLFMGRKKAIWNNKGDIAILTNREGIEVTRFSYYS